MRNLISTRLAAALLSVGLLGLGGCGGDGSSQTFSGTYTLQGTVMNAVTGEHIGGDDLKIYLIQGTDVRTPNNLVKDATDPLVGEYAFSGIPADLNSGNKTYKVVALKGGFQRFEGEVSFTASSEDQMSTVPWLTDATTGPILDTVYNKIGNIYLFPTGATAPSYSYQVVYNGKPVPGATVHLEPYVYDNSNVADMSWNNTIFASPGYLPAITGTTDASGNVTFAGTSLALGAAYYVVVEPVVFEGVQLALYEGSEIYVGFSNTTGIITLSDLSAGGNKYGLYVTSISNSVQGQVGDGSGTLTITFNRAVVLNEPTTTSFWATTTGSGVFNTPRVNALPSADGLTLTLTPIWSTLPSATDKSTSITYSGGTETISVKGYPADTFDVFGLRNQNGGAISGTVNLTGP